MNISNIASALLRRIIYIKTQPLGMGNIAPRPAPVRDFARGIFQERLGIEAVRNPEEQGRDFPLLTNAPQNSEGFQHREEIEREESTDFSDSEVKSTQSNQSDEMDFIDALDSDQCNPAIHVMPDPVIRTVDVYSRFRKASAVPIQKKELDERNSFEKSRELEADKKVAFEGDLLGNIYFPYSTGWNRIQKGVNEEVNRKKSLQDSDGQEEILSKKQNKKENPESFGRTQVKEKRPPWKPTY